MINCLKNHIIPERAITNKKTFRKNINKPDMDNAKDDEPQSANNVEAQKKSRKLKSLIPTCAKNMMISRESWMSGF